jgi:two-component system invasion response regulator UvrY
MLAPAPHPSHRQIRVGLVDDHLILRRGLQDFLNTHPDLRVVGQAGSGREALDLVRTTRLDVLILDIEMPRQTGVDAIGLLRAKAPEMGVLVLSGHPVSHYGVAMIRKGASGFLSKQCQPAEIATAVRKIAQGRRYLSEELVALMADVIRPNQGAAAHEKLTSREFQVFLKLARGDDSEKIASELSLSPKTVSSYRIKVMGKLELRTNANLTYYAMKHHLVD